MAKDFSKAQITRISKEPMKAPCTTCGETGLYWVSYRFPDTPAGTKDSVRPGYPDGKFHYCRQQKYGFNQPRVNPSPVVPSPVTPEPNVPQPFVPPNPFQNRPQPEPQQENKPMPSPDGNAALYELVKPFVQQDILDAVSAIEIPVVRHDVHIHDNANPEAEPKVIKDARPEFADLLFYLSTHENVALVGPAGSGKTYGAELVANALNVPFWPISVGPMTSKSDLIGFTSPAGRAIWTQIREAYEHGGVLLLDELDAGNPGVLTTLNALLANDSFVFPADDFKLERVHKHKDFYCIAALNTFGLGADMMFVGRAQLDEATRDRFQWLNWDYDTALETRIAGQHTRYYDEIKKLRAKAQELEIRVTFGTRKLIRGVKYLNAGKSFDWVCERVFWVDVSADDRSKLTAL